MRRSKGYRESPSASATGRDSGLVQKATESTVYSHSFSYHRAATLEEASQMLLQLGEESRLLAGGQSLIPLMKMRLARPTALVDINRILGLDTIQHANGDLRFGALARHTDIEQSEIASAIPILHDCAAGIADVQVRNQGTIGGSLAEADPSGDWATTLLTLESSVRCAGTKTDRTVPLEEFIKDAYTTVLKHGELVREVVVKVPPKGSGGAYIAFKRCAPVYATASAAVQLTLDGKNTCKDVRIVLGCVGLTALRSKEAETVLRGKAVDEKSIQAAANAARETAQPQSDMRGSAEYKRMLAGALVKRALGIAARRARGERVEAGHEYAGRRKGSRSHSRERRASGIRCRTADSARRISSRPLESNRYAHRLRYDLLRSVHCSSERAHREVLHVVCVDGRRR
jgi:carbon-monoxide dehydrogenase medium subunit